MTIILDLLLTVKDVMILSSPIWLAIAAWAVWDKVEEKWEKRKR